MLAGNQIGFCFLFIASRSLLQKHPNSIDFSKGNVIHVLSVRNIVLYNITVKTSSDNKYWPFCCICLFES